MKAAVIFIIIAPSLSLQDYRHRSESCSSELSASRQSLDYEYERAPYYRTSRKHRHKKHTSKEKRVVSDELDAVNDKYVRHERHSHRRSKPRFSKNEYSDNCVCDCQKCEDLQQCCQRACNKECDQPEQNNQVDQAGLSPGNLVFVPYPYPLVVPPPVPQLIPPVVPLVAPQIPPSIAPPVVTAVTTSTAPSIVESVALNTRKQADSDNDSYLDLLRSLKHRKELAIDHGTRTVKRYMPTYDTISDRLLDQLISQVRSVKDINSTD